MVGTGFPSASVGTRWVTGPRMTSQGSSIPPHTQTKSERLLEAKESLVPLSPCSSTFGNEPYHFQARRVSFLLPAGRGAHSDPGVAVPVLHIQHVPPCAQGLRAGAPRAAAVLDPLQDAINVFQPIFLKAPKPRINHRPHFILNVKTTDDHVIRFDKKQRSHC